MESNIMLNQETWSALKGTSLLSYGENNHYPITETYEGLKYLKLLEIWNLQY